MLEHSRVQPDAHPARDAKSVVVRVESPSQGIVHGASGYALKPGFPRRTGAMTLPLGTNERSLFTTSDGAHLLIPEANGGTTRN